VWLGNTGQNDGVYKYCYGCLSDVSLTSYGVIFGSTHRCIGRILNKDYIWLNNGSVEARSVKMPLIVTTE